ncbi:MAG: hypothetical protein AAB719_01850 [Patescibacteria group bacterium]
MHKKLNLNLHVELFKFGKSQEGDWKIISLSTAVLAVLIIALSIFTFIKIDKGEIFSANESVSENGGLDLNLLKETASYYENKKLEFERIKSSNPTGIDPSL